MGFETFGLISSKSVSFVRNYKSTKSVVIETISEAQYKEKKKLSAALLSAPVPSIINKW
jgi:hypothetical protein